MSVRPAERLVPVKCEIIDDDSVLPVTTSGVYVQWLPDKACMMSFNFQGDRGWSYCVTNDDENFQSNVSAEVVEDFDDAFAQETLCVTGGSFSVYDSDVLVTGVALQPLSKPVSSSCTKLADISTNLVDVIEMLWTAAKVSNIDFAQQNGFLSGCKKPASDTLNDLVKL